MAITTSADYKTAIKADSEITRLEAEFGFIPDGAVEGAAVSSDDIASISKISQVKNGVRLMPLFATCEPGRWLLNGKFDLIDTNNSAQQTGYFSQSMCDENGLFVYPKPYILYTLNTVYDIVGVTLFFDYYAAEWATNVTIQYYNASEILIKESSFNNDNAVMPIEYPVSGVKRIRVTINSWNVANRRAKVPQMLPGELFLFTPKNTFSFNFNESIQPFSTSIEFPEFSVKFDNSDKKFDIVNPSGLMYYLRQMMQVFSKIGVLTETDYEYISTGDFYVYSWPDDTQEDSASLTCKHRLAFVSGNYVNRGTGTQTVAQAVALIISQMGIDISYTIDAVLESIIVNQHIGANVPLVNALAQIAIAAGGYWKFNRDNSMTLKAWSVPAASNSVDYDNMWEKPNITQSNKITSVNVKYYTINLSGPSFVENDNVVTATVNDGSAADDICSGFIPSSERANAIGALALQYYSMRLNYEVKYRGDMSIESSDAITVENDYSDSDVFITSNNITWDSDGKLSGSFKGKGAA